MITSKVMLLGEIGVGKSSIVRRLVFDSFDTRYAPTIGVDVYRYSVPIAEGDEHQLIIWDTDGNFAEAIFDHIYMRQASAALAISDLSRPETIAHAKGLVERFLQAYPGRPCAVVMNKTDLVEPNQTVSSEPIIPNVPTLLTSAATGQNVKHAFEHLASIIRRRGL